ncbi:MAG: AraC family transcriptional regulator [Muribaculaceae bacterium]|nr:AraC family transcriptional regulator [Muribaculaceae bacterium]
MKKSTAITEIDLTSASRIYDKVSYADEELFFADNITSIPNLAQVFKVNFFAFVFCIEGQLSLNLDSSAFALKANDGLFVDTNTVVEGWKRSQDFKCVICAFNSEVAFNFVNRSLFDAIMQVKQQPVVHFSEDEITLMVKYYELAKFKINHPELNFGKETMIGILRSYIYDILGNIGRHLEMENDDMLRQGDKLFRRFVLMLADGQRQGRSVKAYADELCVSPKYLTSICHQHARKTASEMIAQSMVGHIKQLLLYSDMTIKEVAAHLGFDNLSFFGKYVKKHLGVSPNNYRRINGYGR